MRALSLNLSAIRLGRWQAFGVCILLEVGFFHFAWFTTRLDRVEWHLTYFDNCGGKPGLVHGGRITEANPPIDVDRNGQIGLVAGQSVALPISASAHYRITGDVGDLAPYLVIGTDGSPPTGAPAEEENTPLSCVEGTQALDIQDGRLVWSPWDAAAPWKKDAVRLRKIAATCGAGTRPLTADIRREGNTITALLGTCRVEQQAPVGSVELGVLAGPNAALIDREGGWTLRHGVDLVAFAVVVGIGLIHASLLTAGFGLATAPLVLSTLALLELVLPWMRRLTPFVVLFPLVFIWLALGVVAAFNASWRSSRRARSTPARFGLVLVLHLVAAGMVAAIILRIPYVMRNLVGGSPVVNRATGPAHCLLTGYSVPAGVTISKWAPDTFATLSSSCGLCAGAVTREALPGRVFSDIRDLLQKPGNLDVVPGGSVLFWGSGGDDLFWPLFSRKRRGSSLLLISYAVQGTLQNLNSGSREHATVTEFMAMVDRQTDASLATWDEQREAMLDTLATLRAHHLRFGYFHGFLAWDYGTARTPTRKIMLERRRQLIESGGQTFVDLLAELRPEVSVSWFNDMIHMSLFGHRRVAALMCEKMTRATEAAGKSP